MLDDLLISTAVLAGAVGLAAALPPDSLAKTFEDANSQYRVVDPDYQKKLELWKKFQPDPTVFDVIDDIDKELGANGYAQSWDQAAAATKMSEAMDYLVLTGKETDIKCIDTYVRAHKFSETILTNLHQYHDRTNDPIFLVGSGLRMIQQEQEEAAMLYFKKAFEEDKNLDSQVFSYAGELSDKGRWEQAAFFYKLLLDIDPNVDGLDTNRASVLYGLGRCKFNIPGKKSECRKLMEEAQSVANDPNHPDILWYLNHTEE